MTHNDYPAQAGACTVSDSNARDQQQQQLQDHVALPFPNTTTPPPLRPLEDTPTVWVDTPALLHAMVARLQQASSIALDTEHSSLLSYTGVTCLMQVSTGTTDFLVDTLALAAHLGPALRPLLSNPAILKVLHGCANDLVWLQRDFDLTLVNVFDSEKAAAALGLTERSLGALLQRYYGVTQDKRHQTADWSQRPLPPELVTYARGDVHWLRHLAWRLQQDLLARSSHACCSCNPSSSSGSNGHAASKRGDCAAATELPQPPSGVPPDSSSSGSSGGGSNGCGMSSGMASSTGRSADHDSNNTPLCARRCPALLSVVVKSQALTQRGYTAQPPEVAVAHAASAAWRRFQQQQQQQQQHSAAVWKRGQAPLLSQQQQEQGQEEMWEEQQRRHHDNLQQQHRADLVAQDAVALLVAWRDSAARTADLGCQAVLPESALLELAACTAATARAAAADGGGSHDRAAVHHLQNSGKAAAAAAAAAPVATTGCGRLGDVSNTLGSKTTVITDSCTCSSNCNGSSSNRLPCDVSGLLAMVQGRLDVLNNPAADRSCYGPRHQLSQPLQQQAAQLLQMLQQVGCSWAGKHCSSSGSSSKDTSSTAAAVAAGVLGDSAEGDSHMGHSTSSNSSSYPSSCLTPDSPMAQGVPHLQAAIAAIAAAVSGGGCGASGTLGAGSSSGSGRRKQRSADQEADWRARMIKKFSAKKVVYENCRMLSQAGELLCYCDARKLAWYVDKGIAQLVCEEPPTIQLTFEHQATDQAAGLDGFYATSKSNRCVVCGNDTHYLRYRVVPSCYRRCFPQQLKSHRSHDIVLLCIDCHQTAHKASEKLKQQLALEYGVPLRPAAAPAAGGLLTGQTSGQLPEGDEEVMSMYTHSSVTPAALATHARAAAIALHRFGNTIPSGRRQELEDLVKRQVRTGQGAVNMEAPLTEEEVAAGLLIGLSAKKREVMLRKLKGQQRNRVGPATAAAAAAGAAEAAAAADDEEIEAAAAAAAAGVGAGAGEGGDEAGRPEAAVGAGAEAGWQGAECTVACVHQAAPAEEQQQEQLRDVRHVDGLEAPAAGGACQHISSRGPVVAAFTAVAGQAVVEAGADGISASAASSHQQQMDRSGGCSSKRSSGISYPYHKPPSGHGAAVTAAGVAMLHLQASSTADGHTAAGVDPAPGNTSSTVEQIQQQAAAADLVQQHPDWAPGPDVDTTPNPSSSTLQQVSGHQWHGEQVVAAALRRGGEEALHDLVRRFRRCFVAALRPVHLPPAWDVDNIGQRAFGEYSVYRAAEQGC